MAIKVYNTLTKQKEEFIPKVPGKASMYVCGVTPYNHPHIGNARPFVTWDVIRRFLEHEGYDVMHVQNFTDVDDKIINSANKEGVQWFDICNRYIDSYFEVMDKLNVRRAHVYPRVSEHMDDIIKTVQTLIDNGYGYVIDGDVYYSVEKFERYGELSGRKLEDMMAGARIDIDDRKHNPMDFALWKSAKPGEPYWESPWGQGRPGWHIECSAMNRRFLGNTIDIHCGGQDLIFPHHENEIAQSECCNDAPFANYWMHNGYINVDNVKMSKSLGNFFTVRDVAEKYGYEPIRYLMISSHYRSPINYSTDIIEQCKAALQRLYTCRDALDFAAENAHSLTTPEDFDLKKKLDAHRAAFIEAMDDDLNTADALASIYDLVRDINIILKGKASSEIIEYATEEFDELTGVLGLVYNRKKESLDIDVEKLIEERNQARKNKDFALADKIRDDLKAQGIILEDTPQGVKWHKA